MPIGFTVSAVLIFLLTSAMVVLSFGPGAWWAPLIVMGEFSIFYVLFFVLCALTRLFRRRREVIE